MSLPFGSCKTTEFRNADDDATPLKVSFKLLSSASPALFAVKMSEPSCEKPAGGKALSGAIDNTAAAVPKAWVVVEVCVVLVCWPGGLLIVILIVGVEVDAEITGAVAMVLVTSSACAATLIAWVAKF